MIYLDTGCVLKLYYPEPESEAVAALVTGQAVALTSLHALELTTALEQKLQRKEARAVQIASTHALLKDDLRAGILHRPAVAWEDVLEDARALSRTHTRRIGCRSLDILHCAVARSLLVSTFVTTDKRQQRLARAIGLSAPSVTS